MKSLDTYINEGLLTSKESPLFPEFTTELPGLLIKLKNAKDTREYYEISNQIADETTKRHIKKIKANVIPGPDTVYITWSTSYSTKINNYVKRIYVVFNSCIYFFDEGKPGKNPITKFDGIISGYKLRYFTGGPSYFKMGPVVSKEIIQTIELIYDEKS